MKRTPSLKLAVSVASLDMLHLADALDALHDAGATELLLPVGDGDVAPFSFGADLAHRITSCTDIPCHVLLLARRPERHVDAFAAAGCAAMTIAFEAAAHHHRVLSCIRDAGMGAGIAINPATSLTMLDYLLEKADRVCLFGLEYGEKDNPASLSLLVERVRRLCDNIHYRELPTQVMPYNGLDLALAKQTLEAGASVIGLEQRMLDATGTPDAADAVRQCVAALTAADDTT